MDRSAQARSRRLQLRRAWHGRRPRLERNRLHLCADHQYERCPALTQFLDLRFISSRPFDNGVLEQVFKTLRYQTATLPFNQNVKTMWGPIVAVYRAKRTRATYKIASGRQGWRTRGSYGFTQSVPPFTVRVYRHCKKIRRFQRYFNTKPGLLPVQRRQMSVYLTSPRLLTRSFLEALQF